MLGPIFLITLSSTGLFVLLVPAILIALATQEIELAINMSLVAALGAFLALMILAAIADRIRTFERELNFVSLVMIWIFTPLVASVGLMVLTGLSFFPAWFEAVGALTTSGATVLDRDRQPVGILFWRASLEWYGGFLTLISIIHVLAPAGFGGLRPSARRRGTAGQPDGRWGYLSAYSSVFWQYGALTVAVALGLLVCRVEPANAVMLAMISIATGGFLPFTEPLEEHVGTAAMFVMAIGLCIGTLSVFWRRNVLRHPRRLFQDNREAIIVMAAIAGIAILYAARIADASGLTSAFGLGPALVEGFFSAASLVSTSGIETRPGILSLLPMIAVLTIVFVGGSVYSTTGGIKYYRVVSMWIFARAELNRLIFPSGVTALRFGRQHIPDADIRAVWSYFVLAILCVATGTVIISLSAADFEGGLAMAVSFFSGASPLYEALRPPGEAIALAEGDPTGWPPFTHLPPTALLMAILLMTIGRLEVLIVFAVVNISYWLKR